MHYLRFAALTAVAVVGLASVASAADLPVKAPPPVAPVSWTGFYINGGVGYGMYNADTTWFGPGGTPFLPLTQKQGGRGWLGTIGVGYDYQFTNNIVAGVLADYDFADIKGTIQNQGPFTVGTMKETSAWAVGARVGWLVTPEMLTYFNGGYTRAHFSAADMIQNVFPATGTPFSSVPSQTYSGWFLGSGVEAKLPWFGNGWFARTEYRYASYGSKTLPDVCTIGGCVAGTPVALVSIHPYVQTVRSELVYKFNWGR
jgi:outer membrane immunogenic protein